MQADGTKKGNIVLELFDSGGELVGIVRQKSAWRKAIIRSTSHATTRAIHPVHGSFAS